MMIDAGTILTTAKSNPYFERALESTHGYSSAVALRDAAQRRRLQLPAVAPPTPPTTADAIDDYLAAVADAEAQLRSRDAQMTALADLVRRADGEIVAAVLVNPDVVLASLAEDFAALIERVEHVSVGYEGHDLGDLGAVSLLVAAAMSRSL
jgi:hypothetical protein